MSNAAQIPIIPSGEGLNIVSPASIEGPNFINAISFLVKTGYDFISSTRGNHFKFCAFKVEDLKSLTSQENCAYVLLSHVACTTQSGAKHSTLIASAFSTGGLISTPESKAYIAAESYPIFKLGRSGKSFDFLSELLWVEDDNISVEWSPNTNPSFTSWVQQASLGLSQSIINAGDGEDLIKGAFYPVSAFNEILFQDENATKIGVFPINITAVYKKDTSEEKRRAAVTYILLPMNSDNALSFPDIQGPNLPVSKLLWPEFWDQIPPH